MCLSARGSPVSAKVGNLGETPEYIDIAAKQHDTHAEDVPSGEPNPGPANGDWVPVSNQVRKDHFLGGFPTPHVSLKTMIGSKNFVPEALLFRGLGAKAFGLQLRPGNSLWPSQLR